MCYHCATNPSIHHHYRHVAAVSLPLSHHGVAFMSVVVSSLPSWCRLCHCIVTVLLLPLCHCSAFTVTLSWFCRPHRSVAFVVTLSWFHHCHRGVAFAFVAVSSLPLQCRLHCCIVAVSSLQLHHCGAFAVTSSLFRRH